MLRAILNKSWRQHPTKQQVYGHLPPITKTMKIRRTRLMGHCWRSRDKLISDVFLWTPLHGRAKAERPARTYIQQLCVDTRCSPVELPEAMDDREGWRERGLRISVLAVRHDDDDDCSKLLLYDGRAKAGRPARTYIQQLCEDTGCCPEDLPEAMNDREKGRERVRDIRATSTTWWWWWWLLYEN